MNDVIKTTVRAQLNSGQAKATRGQTIANRLGMKNDRLIRIAIRELIADGLPIASSVQKPYGYFIIETPEEAEAYMAVIKSRLVEDAYRRRDFKKAAFNIRVPEQLKLRLV